MKGSSQHSWDEFRRAVKESGGEVKENTWLGSNKGHYSVCANGHECLLTPSRVRANGVRCPVCSQFNLTDEEKELANIPPIDDLEWMERAACHGMSWEKFYSNKPTELKESITVCDTCRVKTECLVFALWHPENYGVWGGRISEDRANLRMKINKRRMEFLLCSDKRIVSARAS